MSDLLPNIWKLQSQADIAALNAALQHSNVDIRKRAASALRVLGAVDAIPMLQQALQVETDSDTYSHISAALEQLLLDQREQVPKFIAQLSSDNPETVIRAAKTLATIKDKSAVEPLVLLFHNSSLSGKLRLAAAEALIDLNSAPAIVTLLAALRNDNWTIRRNAIAVLGQLRADWAVTPIINHVRDSHPLVRATARAALKRIGTPEALRFIATGSLKDTVSAAKASDNPNLPGDDEEDTQPATALPLLPDDDDEDTKPPANNY